MFESDDFDQVLSQFDFSDLNRDVTESKENKVHLGSNHLNECSYKYQEKGSNNIDVPLPKKLPTLSTQVRPTSVVCNETPALMTPKLVKRKIITTLFDHNSKRKFPGPAGLLTGSLKENNDQTICQMELLSQDLEFSQTNNHKELFESPLWRRLLEDMKTWNISEVNAIKTIKLQALNGNLQCKKAQAVTAFIETIDRSAVDPLIILRDATGSIKCTLHRDAWLSFSPFIVSDCCAVVLWKPTVLTTGSAFKKHYLNITLSNIYAIYTTAVQNIEDTALPDGYTRISEDNFTVIKNENSSYNLSSDVILSSEADNSDRNDLLEELDNIFSDVF